MYYYNSVKAITYKKLILKKKAILISKASSISNSWTLTMRVDHQQLKTRIVLMLTIN